MTAWTADRFIDRLERIRTAGTREKPALHKPLLLLLVISRIHSGDSCENRFPYSDLEELLRDLLRDFGWMDTRGYHPEFPFHYLESDGFWTYTLEGAARSNPPSPRILREHHATGSLAPGLFTLLKENPVVRLEVASFLLDRYWSPSLHLDLRTRLGLLIQIQSELTRKPAVEERKRSTGFPREVLLAYEGTCAFCGYRAHFNGALFGVEAAHVRCFTANGPDEIENGLCLCGFHHWAFDRGAMGITEDYRIQVSQKVITDGASPDMLEGLSGRPVRPPMKGYPVPGITHVRWHLEHRFRPPARGF